MFVYHHSSTSVPLVIMTSAYFWLGGTCFSSVAQSCPTLCDPMNCSTPGLPVHHQLLEFTQTQVHRVSDAIQPSHPLSSPSPPAPQSLPASVFSRLQHLLIILKLLSMLPMKKYSLNRLIILKYNLCGVGVENSLVYLNLNTTSNIVTEMFF